MNDSFPYETLSNGGDGAETPRQLTTRRSVDGERITAKEPDQMLIRREFHFPLSPSPVPSPTDHRRRRRPLLNQRGVSSSSPPSSLSDAMKPCRKSCCGGRFKEIAGATAAECAAVCCCFPCGLVNLIVLAVYTVPARLFRATIKRKRKEKMVKNGLLPAKINNRCDCGDGDGFVFSIHTCEGFPGGKEIIIRSVGEESEAGSDAMIRMENEMWQTFYGTGFWRSISRKEAIPSSVAGEPL